MSKTEAGTTGIQNQERTASSSSLFRKRQLLEAIFYKVAEIQFGVLRGFLAIGVRPKLFEMTLRTYLKRPEWLYGKSVVTDPVGRFTCRSAPNADDQALCERLIAAYRAASARANSPVSSIWSGNIQKHYHGLLCALENGSPKQLSDLLARMFQESFLYGIASCTTGLRAGRFIRMKLIEELLALAESLGVVRTETPEQGTLGHGFSIGLEKLVERIEAQLGISLDFPNLGGAYGIEIGGRLITPEAPEHIYVACRIREIIGNHFQASPGPKILEIGAGFGGTAYWLMRLQPIARYTIIDLPLMNVCQGYFLAKTFGESAVRLCGESGSETGAQIHILPAHAKDQTGGFDLLLNENSMPEIPENIVKDYLSWAKSRGPKLFYSYNQEAFSPGHDNVPQTLVPEAVAAVGGFQRLSRNYSWVRRGYVEEVYKLANS